MLCINPSFFRKGGLTCACLRTGEKSSTNSRLLQIYNHDRFQKKLNQCAPVEYRHTLAA
ncbi:IS3 family transposase [Bacillus altitudinis]|uniref:IS3 family transposase n=1 Tax=Bacillus altitudinis TaxID=293387 RepID=UPI00398FA0C7